MEPCNHEEIDTRLIVHLKDAILNGCHNCLNNTGWGWTLEETMWIPVWSTLPIVAKVCSELIKCGCKSQNGCGRCTCRKAGWKLLNSAVVTVGKQIY